MNLDQVKDRLHQAKVRIHEELDSLSKDLGPGISVDVSVDWLSVGTMTDPSSTIPSVELTAVISPYT